LAVGSWQLAVGSWQLAVGSWQLANFKKSDSVKKGFTFAFSANCQLSTAD
jgi:hypothetical protein